MKAFVPRRRKPSVGLRREDQRRIRRLRDRAVQQVALGDATCSTRSDEAIFPTGSGETAEEW